MASDNETIVLTDEEWNEMSTDAPVNNIVLNPGTNIKPTIEIYPPVSTSPINTSSINTSSITTNPPVINSENYTTEVIDLKDQKINNKVKEKTDKNIELTTSCFRRFCCIL